MSVSMMGASFFDKQRISCGLYKKISKMNIHNMFDFFSLDDKVNQNYFCQERDPVCFFNTFKIEATSAITTATTATGSKAITMTVKNECVDSHHKTNDCTKRDIAPTRKTKLKVKLLGFPPTVRISHRLLGRGRQGSVWLAEDIERVGVLFAVKKVEVPIAQRPPVHQLIKMLDDSFACSAISQTSAMSLRKLAVEATLYEEACLWQGLSHPGLVRLHGADILAEDGGNAVCHFYAEYMQCGSLLSFVQTHYQDGRLGERALRWFLKPVLEGLCYMHENNVVHQDVKAENIFVKWSDRSYGSCGVHVNCLIRRIPVAKLGDFGCARSLSTSANSTNNRPSLLSDVNLNTVGGGRASAQKLGNMPCGTLGFIAPEIILQLHSSFDACSPAADVWSFGCTVLQLLRGASPVRPGAGAADILFETAMYPKKIQRFIPRTVTEMDKLIDSPSSRAACKGDENIFISTSLRDLLLRCLQQNPSKRATAAQLLSHPFFLEGDFSFKDAMEGVINTDIFCRRDIGCCAER